jgi:hypothetical protein
VTRTKAAAFVASLAIIGGTVGLFAHAVAGTGAYFTDSHAGSIRMTLATPTPTPMPALSATVRVEPQTINLKGKGEVTAFIDKLPAPHALSEVDLSSVTLCYAGACIPSVAPAKIDGKAHVAAKFDRAALAGLVGTARGDLTLVVQGRLVGGGTFSGSDVNRVTGGDPGDAQGAGAAPPVGGAPAP